MKKTFHIFAIAAAFFLSPNLRAAVSIAHVENSTVGQFLSSSGGAATGAVSIGFFSSAVSDAAFGTTITDWASLLAAGYIDVRTTAGATLGTGFDWDQPGIGGTVQNVPFATTGSTPSASQLPQGTQLYIVAFNSGTFNTGTPASSFGGSSEWAVLKDGVGPANNLTRTSNLSTITGILIGTDNSGSDFDVRMAPLGAAPIPEPSRLILLGLGGLGLVLRRRRC